MGIIVKFIENNWQIICWMFFVGWFIVEYSDFKHTLFRYIMYLDTISGRLASIDNNIEKMQSDIEETKINTENIKREVEYANKDKYERDAHERDGFIL